MSPAHKEQHGVPGLIENVIWYEEIDNPNLEEQYWGNGENSWCLWQWTESSHSDYVDNKKVKRKTTHRPKTFNALE